jgi:hypothetical protein
VGRFWPEALSMTPAVDIKLRTLVVLQEQVEELRGPAAELDASSGTGDVARARRALTGARRVLDQLAATTSGLRAQVLAADGDQLGGTVESAEELVIRAVTILVATQLGALAEAIQSDPRHDAEHTRGWFAGPFQTLQDVASFVDATLERARGIWSRYRRDVASLGPATEARRARHRDAVREAQRAVAAIGDEPAIAHLLRAGMAAPGWPAVHTACTELAGALRFAGRFVTSPRRLPIGERPERPLEPTAATRVREGIR